MNDSPNDPHQDLNVPIEPQPMDIEAPARRVASAEFNVDAEIGSEAALREAMDPANKSLTDALHMSFRVLQFVIIVLLVLFLFSGFKTIGNNESGVATTWGRVDDIEGLGPGFHMNWPAPVGGFVVVGTEPRTATDGRAFLASTGGAINEEDAIQNTLASSGLVPGRDGSVLVEGGELAHVEISVQYEVADVVEFIEQLPAGAPPRLVQLAIQRAVVHVGAKHTLQQLRETLSAEELRALIRAEAQATLNAVDSGIRIVDVILEEKFLPPRFIQKSFEEFTVNRQLAQQVIQTAQKEADELLIKTTGEYYAELTNLIDRYEEAWELDSPDAASIMEQINAFFDGDRVAGVSSNYINNAYGYLANIDTSVGMEARRFQGLLDAYREHPQLVVAQRWLEVYGEVMDRPDVEVMYVPRQLGSMALDLSGLQAVKDIRRRTEMQRRELEATYRDLDLLGSTLKRVDEMKEAGRAGRQLEFDDAGRVKGLRSEELDKK
ncbi:MAG: SPFH domain-containing protein [Phycisphaerales bacterium]|nr:SPFH domain-containing protein [Phycisphaerales bacterium]